MTATNIEKLVSHLEVNELVLSENITFENDGGRNIVIICDNEAVSSDEKFLFETYDISEAVEFLVNNGYLTNGHTDHTQFN